MNRKNRRNAQAFRPKDKCNLTTAQLETRLDMVEGLMAKANEKDLPALNSLYQKILDELVSRDLTK